MKFFDWLYDREPEPEGEWKFEKVEDKFQTTKVTTPNGNTVYVKYFTEAQIKRLQPSQPCDHI